MYRARQLSAAVARMSGAICGTAKTRMSLRSSGLRQLSEQSSMDRSRFRVLHADI
jgi:hypothetical protein